MLQENLSNIILKFPYIYMERKFLLRYIQQFCQQHSSPESLAIHIQNSLHILTTSFPRLETSLRFNLFFYTLFSLRQRFTGFHRHRSFRPLVFLHTSGIHASTRLCVSSMWPMDGDRAAIHSVWSRDRDIFPDSILSVLHRPSWLKQKERKNDLIHRNRNFREVKGIDGNFVREKMG